LQLSWEEPIPACVAAYGQQNQPFQSRGGSGEARDYSNYLTDLNTGRYGVATRDNYRVTTADLQRANRLQFVDPIFLVALWRYGSDYVVDGKNTTRLPMIPLGTTGVSYLPGLRIDLSPFGIEYIQDNFIRYGGSLTNLFWTRGDDKYERRLGAGFDVTGVPLFAGATGGAFGELYKQPLLSRVDRAGPLTAAEFGVLHNAWNAGLTLRAPLFSFGSDSKDPMRVIMTLTVGRKNTGWIPGEYIKGSTYAETGLGLRL
jgi:hypothetical protein